MPWSVLISRYRIIIAIIDYEEIKKFLIFSSTFGNCIVNVMMRQVEALLKLYANEKYILTVNQQLEHLKFYVSFKVCFYFPYGR